MRAIDDPAFVEVQKRMRNTELDRPVCPEFLESLSAVSGDDVEADPEWRFAPIGVISRLERVPRACAAVRSRERPLLEKGQRKLSCVL